MTMTPALAVALSLGFGWMGSAAAQSALDCPAQMGENEGDRQDRCTREASLENYGHQLKTQQEFADLRASLMRQPALSPAKNPLLGRWSLPNAGQGGSDDALPQLFGVIGSFASCGPLVGASQIEFLPGSMVSIAGDGERSPASANYRSGKGGVYALTPLYVMFFEFLSPNRIQLGNVQECKLARVGGAASAPTAAAPKPAPSTARPAVASAASGSSRVTAGAAFRCKEDSLLVVEACTGGPDPGCSTWSASDGGRNPGLVSSPSPRSQIEQWVKACERGTARTSPDQVVTFVPGP